MNRKIDFIAEIIKNASPESTTAFNWKTSTNTMKKFIIRRSIVNKIVLIIADATGSTSINADSITTHETLFIVVCQADK